MTTGCSCTCTANEIDPECHQHGCTCSSVVAHLIDEMGAKVCRYTQNEDERQRTARSKP